MKNRIFTKRKLNHYITRYALLTILVLVIGGYFGFRHYKEYQDARNAFKKETTQLLELRNVTEQTKSSYLSLKKEFDTKNTGINQSIESILPSDEDFTNLARQLDKYFLDTRSSNNSMFLSSLSFSQQDTKDNEFAILPFTMNLTGDEKGLNNFLKYVENSGDLNNKSRLLDFTNLSITYSDKKEDPNSSSDSTRTQKPTSMAPLRDVNVSLSMKAYFQKPIEEENNNTNK